MSDKCPCCDTTIDLSDVMEHDTVSSTQKYYDCPVCHGHLIVYLKIDSIEVAEETEEEEEEEE